LAPGAVLTYITGPGNRCPGRRLVAVNILYTTLRAPFKDFGR